MILMYVGLGLKSDVAKRGSFCLRQQSFSTFLSKSILQANGVPRTPFLLKTRIMFPCRRMSSLQTRTTIRALSFGSFGRIAGKAVKLPAYIGGGVAAVSSYTIYKLEEAHDYASEKLAQFKSFGQSIKNSIGAVLGSLKDRSSSTHGLRASKKTSCRICRFKKIKCIKINGSSSCLNCTRKLLECSYD